VFAVSCAASVRSMLLGHVTQLVAAAPVHVKQLLVAGQTAHLGGSNESEESV